MEQTNQEATVQGPIGLVGDLQDILEFLHELKDQDPELHEKVMNSIVGFVPIE